jgi:hypothetical protein
MNEGPPDVDMATTHEKEFSQEEEQWIHDQALDWDARGLVLGPSHITGLANSLINEEKRSQCGYVDRTWGEKFIEKHPTIQARIARSYDYQNRQCDEPRTLEKWFEGLERTKRDLDILDDDIYNFNEICFLLGEAHPRMVVALPEQTEEEHIFLMGDRTWLTVVLAIGSHGQTIPPYFLNEDCPAYRPRRGFGRLPKGWQVDQTGCYRPNALTCIEWLKHFEKHSKPRVASAWRLLILDNSKMQCAATFEKFCNENKIKCFYLPPDSTHITQPLDVGCLDSLKRHYNTAIAEHMRRRNARLAKAEFLRAFKTAYQKAFTKDSIRSGFRDTGLVPFDPRRVTSQLVVSLPPPQSSMTEPSIRSSEPPRELQNLSEQGLDERVNFFGGDVSRNRHGHAASMLEIINGVNRYVFKTNQELVRLREETRELRREVEMQLEQDQEVEIELDLKVELQLDREMHIDRDERPYPSPERPQSLVKVEERETPDAAEPDAPQQVTLASSEAMGRGRAKRQRRCR